MSFHQQHKEENDNNVHMKPNLSYAAIIAEAIICSPERKLTLREIYLSINAKYPFYSLDKSGWQNSIRHNLSLNKAFYKLPKTNASSSTSKGSYWCISPQDAYIILNKTRRTYHQYRMPAFDLQQDYGFNPTSPHNEISKREFGSFNRIDVQNNEKKLDNISKFTPKSHQNNFLDDEELEGTFFSERFDPF